MTGAEKQALWPNGGEWKGWQVSRGDQCDTQGWKAIPPDRIKPPEGTRYLFAAARSGAMIGACTEEMGELTTHAQVVEYGWYCGLDKLLWTLNTVDPG